MKLCSSQRNNPVRSGKNRTGHIKTAVLRIGAILFWIALWWTAAAFVGMEVKLPSPVSVVSRFASLAVTAPFWQAAFVSLARIFTGAAAGIATGTLLAAFSVVSRPLGALISPLITVIRATPVASFILLVLIWIRSDNVPSFIAFLMVTPILWANVRTGIEASDRSLLEAAKLYRLGFGKRLRAIYLPQVLPHFSSGCVTALGLAWKAGIAAEVLCTPKTSIGIHLYQSKLYLETADLFAWTLLVILLSIALESILKLALARFTKKRV